MFIMCSFPCTLIASLKNDIETKKLNFLLQLSNFFVFLEYKMKCGTVFNIVLPHQLFTVIYEKIMIQNIHGEN